MFEQFSVSRNGTAYQLLGEPGQPVIILIHGLGLCRKLWESYLPTLTKTHQVLNYDLYGHGNSQPLPETASLAVYARQLSELMDELNIPQAVIVGFSIGGMINRRFAIDYPDKVAGLAILNSPHDRGEEAQQQVEARAAKVREQGALSTMDSALARWFTSDFHTSNPQTLQLVVDWRLQAEPESYAQAAWVLAEGVRELTQDKLPISTPCLVLTCEKDTGSTPAMSEQICAQLEHSTLKVVPKLQHLGLLEQPKTFLAHLTDFLLGKKSGKSPKK